VVEPPVRGLLDVPVHEALVRLFIACGVRPSYRLR